MALHHVRYLMRFRCQCCRTEFEIERPKPVSTDCPECDAIVQPFETIDTFARDAVET